MAIYHLSAKPISRAKGRTATAAAAYRAGESITDERTGEVHDYSRKGGVLHTELVLPEGGKADRAAFWNAVEQHHKRKDAVVAREIEVSLPKELNEAQRQALAVGYARELADRYGVAADVALHAPRTITQRDLERDPNQPCETDPETGRKHNGNWHAHILLSACHVAPDGSLGKKAVALDPIHCQRAKIANVADREREVWGERVNAALEANGHAERVDHRSHKARGIEAEPSEHLGPAACGFERREGVPSTKRLMQEREASERLALAKAQGEQARIGQSILDLSGNVAAALQEAAFLRDAMQGMGSFRANYDAARREEARQKEAERLRAEEQARAEQQAYLEKLAAEQRAREHQIALEREKERARERAEERERQARRGRDLER